VFGYNRGMHNFAGKINTAMEAVSGGKYIPTPITHLKNVEVHYVINMVCIDRYDNVHEKLSQKVAQNSVDGV